MSISETAFLSFLFFLLDQKEPQPDRCQIGQEKIKVNLRPDESIRADDPFGRLPCQRLSKVLQRL
jgi:hypothetical protein